MSSKCFLYAWEKQTRQVTKLRKKRAKKAKAAAEAAAAGEEVEEGAVKPKKPFGCIKSSGIVTWPPPLG